MFPHLLGGRRGGVLNEMKASTGAAHLCSHADPIGRTAPHVGALSCCFHFLLKVRPKVTQSEGSLHFQEVFFLSRNACAKYLASRSVSFAFRYSRDLLASSHASSSRVGIFKFLPWGYAGDFCPQATFDAVNTNDHAKHLKRCDDGTQRSAFSTAAVPSCRVSRTSKFDLTERQLDRCFKLLPGCS